MEKMLGRVEYRGGNRTGDHTMEACSRYGHNSLRADQSFLLIRPVQICGQDQPIINRIESAMGLSNRLHRGIRSDMIKLILRLPLIADWFV